MNISVFGCGYVGLTTAVCLADTGHNVVGVDIDRSRAEMLAKGRVPFLEPVLETLLKKNISEGRLRFTTSAREGVLHGDVIFCAVATPRFGKRHADLSAVLSVTESFARYGSEGKGFVNKSTVPVGTSEKIRQRIEAYQRKFDNAGGKPPFRFFVVSNPEFLREGSAVSDFLKPDRIVVGLESGLKDCVGRSKELVDPDKVKNIMKEVYKGVESENSPLFFTNIRNAELIKYASNAFLATKISFMNELANFCDKTGGDITEIAKGMAFDPRIGKGFLDAGVGFGGSCLPKDLHILIQTGKSEGFDFKLLQAVKAINDKQVDRIVKIFKKEFLVLKGKKIVIWGASFKPGTDDLRDAPSVKLIRRLLKHKVDVMVYDPACIKSLKREFGCSIMYSCNMYSALTEADALTIITEWDEFHYIHYTKMKKLMKNPLIVDGRNVCNPQDLAKNGFKHYSIGRCNITPSTS